jgi:hypothetical protein
MLVRLGFGRASIGQLGGLQPYREWVKFLFTMPPKTHLSPTGTLITIEAVFTIHLAQKRETHKKKRKPAPKKKTIISQTSYRKTENY